MSRHRRYNYDRPGGSAEGVRRDKQRRFWAIVAMLLIGIAVVAGLLLLMSVK